MVLSGASFGALAIFAKVAYSHGADPVTVLFVRFAIAAVCMIAVMRVRGHRWPRGGTLLALVVLGAVGYVGESLAYFYALTFASAALVALLLYVYPAIVTVLAAVLFGQRLTGVKIAALVIALGGTALTIGRAGGGEPLGIVLGITSALIYAVYILTSSRVVPHAGAIPSSTVVMCSAAVVFGALTLLRGPSYPQAPQGWLALVALALVSTVVAIVAFFAGLRRIGPAEASTASTTEPIVTVILAAIVLGEPIVAAQIVGGAMILAAVVILAQAGRQKLIPEEAPPT